MERATLQTKLKNAEQKLAEDQQANGEIQANLRAAKQHIEALEAQKAAMAAELSSSQHLMGTAKAGEEGLQAALQTAKQHIEALEAQKAAMAAKFSDNASALKATAASVSLFVSSDDSTALSSYENLQKENQKLKFEPDMMTDAGRNSKIELDVNQATTPSDIFRNLEQQKSEGVSLHQSLPKTNPYFFPSNVAQKQAVQRHSNPATSHVSTTNALFTPSKTLVKEDHFGLSSSQNAETTIASPGSLVVPVPNSLGLFDRMRLQARLHSESADIAPPENVSQRLMHTPSRLSTFMGASQVPVSSSQAAVTTRLQDPSTFVGRKLAILGDLNNTEKLAELDPIQASELWQKARVEQRMLRNKQISGDFEERWKNINAIRDSMFKNGDSQYSSTGIFAEIPSAQGDSRSYQNMPSIEHSLVASESGFRSKQVPTLHSPVLSKGFSQQFADAENPMPNSVGAAQLHSTDSSVRYSVTTPKRRLGQHASDQALGDAAMKMSDLRQNVPSTIYNRL